MLTEWYAQEGTLVISYNHIQTRFHIEKKLTLGCEKCWVKNTPKEIILRIQKLNSSWNCNSMIEDRLSMC